MKNFQVKNFQMKNLQLLARIGAVTAGLACGGQALAQTLPLVDDFTPGPMSIVFNGAKQTGDLIKQTSQNGSHILGGKRFTQLELQLGGNPYLQSADLQVKTGNANLPLPAALVSSSGYAAASNPIWWYGEFGDVGKPLDVDLTPYDRIRVTFASISGGINFDIEAWSANDKETIFNCGMMNSETTLVVDFPLANGLGNANLADVTGLLFETEEGGVSAGYNYGISSIQMVAPGTPPGDITCGPTNAENQRQHRRR
jgi:hypothetical protein